MRHFEQSPKRINSVYLYQFTERHIFQRIREDNTKKFWVTGQQAIRRNSTRAFAFVIPMIDLPALRILVHLLLIHSAFPGTENANPPFLKSNDNLSSRNTLLLWNTMHHVTLILISALSCIISRISVSLKQFHFSFKIFLFFFLCSIFLL